MDEDAPFGWPGFERLRAQALLEFDHEVDREGGLRRFTVPEAFGELESFCWTLYTTLLDAAIQPLRARGLPASEFVAQVQHCADRIFAVDVYGWPGGEPGRLGIVTAGLPVPEGFPEMIRANAQCRSARKLKEFETEVLSSAAQQPAPVEPKESESLDIAKPPDRTPAGTTGSTDGSPTAVNQATLIGSREERLQKFLRMHPGTSYTDVYHSARVYKTDFQKWRHDKLSDTSVMAVRIEDVLAGGVSLKRKPRKGRAE